MNPEHQEEVKVLNQLMNSKLVIALATLLIAGPTTWLLAGAIFTEKVNTVIDQNKMEHYQDSLQNKYLIDRNENLIDALERSNQSIMRLDTTVSRVNQQIHGLKEDVEYIRNRIDKQKP